MKPVLVAVFVACLLSGCSGGDTASTPTTTNASTAGTPGPAVTAGNQGAATTATPTPAVLSLVYLDSSRGQGTELYVAAFDGAGPRLVATLPNPARPLDVSGKILAVAGQGGIAFYDLATGQSRTVTASGTVTSGRFLSSNVFLYSTTAGCAGGAATLQRVDLGSMQQRELVALAGNIAIAGVDGATGTVAIVPRGCDPAVQSIVLYNANTGAKVQDVAAPGCGFVDVSIAGKKALVSWMACTPVGLAPQASFYDFASAAVTKKDIVGPSGGINSQPILLRPGANEAVFGARSGGGGAPGSVTATGVWTVDLLTLSVGVLVPGQGAEQSPVAWTPDGRYLLVQSVEAMGRCTYSYADATTKRVTPINAAITFCGVNGEVVGWTSLQ